MADTNEHSERLAGGQSPGGPAPWSQVWHLPVLLLGLGIFVLGLYFLKPEAEPNRFPEALDEVAVYLRAENLPAAEEKLDQIQANLDQADPVSMARHWQYRGDLTYAKLHRQLPDTAWSERARETHDAIVRFYTESDVHGQPIGRELDAGSLRRFAETLVAIGRTQQALIYVDRLDPEPARHRYQILRQMIERQRQAGPASSQADAVALLIQKFQEAIAHEKDAQRLRQQQIWLESVRAERLLEAGDPGRAISRLITQIARMQVNGPSRDLTPLHVLLGRAYQLEGSVESARAAYQRAHQLIQDDPSNRLHADILVGLAQLALAGQRIEQALDYFTQAVQQYPSEPAYVEALIGQADSHARLESYTQAKEQFALAVRKLAESSPSWDPRRRQLTAAVRSHLSRLTDQQRYEGALEFLNVLVPLHDQELPERLLLDFARTHLALAEQRRAAAGELMDAEAAAAADGAAVDGLAAPTREARRLANQEAAVHFASAADFFRRHARRVTIDDDEAHGQSLWNAADAYDQAQLWRQAINTYSEFIHTRQTDPLRLRAVHRLGQAYLADGQYEAAAEQFRQLTEHHPRSPETYESLVPMAQALMGLGKIDDAERTLLNVVTDHEAIRPDSAEYRLALIELGKLYYRRGETEPSRYVQAIERLSEAVERYGKTSQSPTLRYLLADAHRKSVPALQEEIDRRQSPRHRMELQQELNDRLSQAQIYYNQTLNELEARPEESLSPLEQLYLRNAYFYQADCAFDREQFELAIDLYDQASRRWRRDPASLVALVQIVNAHCEMGQFAEARVANDRARDQLKRMPEEAFQDSELLPMSRQHWEDWLRWTSQQELYGPATQAIPTSSQTRR